MQNSSCFFFLCCISSHLTQPSISSSFVELQDRTPICQSKSTVKGHTLLVKHGEPLNGKVLITATVLPSIINVSMCKWIFYLNRSMIKTELCNPDYLFEILKETSLNLTFSRPGLKELVVAAEFSMNDNRQSLWNCTFINVSDCSRQLKLAASTSKGSFNISRNHSTLTLDSPGMVNFTILVFDIKDPFYLICQPLYYKWSFGDGQYLLNTTDNNVHHFYNSSGLLVLDIFEDKDEKKLYKNISVTVHVKEKPPSDSSMDTGVDVTLVLIILLVVIILLGGFVVFRKKVHKFTEVAMFDFRDEDFPSTTTNLHCKQGGFFRRLFPGRTEENKRLFTNDPYSTRQSFGSTLPTEEF